MRLPAPISGAAIAPVRPRPTPPDYAAAATDMAPARRMVFLSGRVSAHRALRRAGAPAGPVPKAQSGAPLWPEGWSGSISHDRMRAVTVIADARHRVGVDLEDLRRHDSARAASRLCLDAGERVLFPTPRDGICAFSAKEAVFKALSAEAPPRFWLPAIRLLAVTSAGIDWCCEEIDREGRVRLATTATHVLSLCCVAA